MEFWLGLGIGNVVYCLLCCYMADYAAERRYRHLIAMRDTLIEMQKQVICRENRLRDPDDTEPPSAPLPLDPKSLRRRREEKQQQEQAAAMKEYGGG